MWSESVKAEALKLLNEGKGYTEVEGILNGPSRRAISTWFPGRRKGGPRRDREEILASIESGMSDKEVAVKFNMNQDAVQKFRTRHGIKRSNANWPKLTDEQKNRIGELLDEGYSFRAIHQVTGHNEETIRRHFPGRGYSPRESGQAAQLALRAKWLYEMLGSQNAA